MRNLLLLLAVCGLLSGCLKEVIFGSDKTASPRTEQDALHSPVTGEVVKIWMPDDMRQTAAWPFQARGEEARCSNGHYLGKNDWELFPSQRSIYKILPNSDRIWAYYYYGEDIPGFTTTKWYITVFNIYAHSNGEIYGCVWDKYPSSYRSKYSTSDGINPNIHPPR